jgi:hypothetical protein
MAAVVSPLAASLARPGPTSFQPRPAIRHTAPARRLHQAPRAQEGEPAVSEDVIARLRAAEEEAQRLKKELAAAQAAVSLCEEAALGCLLPSLRRLAGGW